MKTFGVIICICLCIFVGWQIFGLAKDIKKRQENKRKQQEKKEALAQAFKEEETNKEQTENLDQDK